jgi:DNA primase
VNQQISDKIEEIFDKLGIDYIVKNNGLNFSCPIHGSSSNSAFVYTDSDLYPPNWKCYTHNCHEEYGSSLIGLLKGLLKTDYQGCLDFLDNLNIKPNYNQNNKLIQSSKIITYKRYKPQYKISLNEIEYVKPKFYLDRGFKESTLKHFGISYCNNRKNPFFGYITVPIFNDDKKSVAGFIARNPNPKCLICGKYHKENDPCSKNGTKWKNTKGFHNNSFFYNLWNAKEHINKNKEVILVEGAADVWRLFEAGIYNVLGMFGTSITMDQKVILETLQILTIKLFLDNDEAGINAALKLKKYLERFYTVKIIKYKKQPSECNDNEIRSLLNV